jgi:hypothetical protein
LTIGTACFAAGDTAAPSQGTPAADSVVETLLHRIVQQIADGRIISPADDNAMQTWQRVLQRDIATRRSPEVLKALEDFDTYARVHAADEKASGHVLVAAELTVFADQASKMTGRAPPIEPSGSTATAANSVDNGPQSGGGTAAPADAKSGETAQPQPTTAAATPTSVALPDAAGSVAAEPAATTNPAVEISPPHSAPVDVAASTSGAGPRSPSASGIVSVADVVMHVAPHVQTFGSSSVAVETTSDDGRPMRSTGSAGSQAEGTERAVALTIATGSAAPRPSTPAVLAAAASTETIAPSEIAVPAAGAVPSIIAGATGNEAQSPSAGRSGVTQFAAANVAPRAPTDGVSDIAQAQSAGTANDPPPANASIVPPPAAPETPMAAFYATRGDDMLAHKDVSAARKFYEFAANEGSARAAVALAKTYDPAFADQLGVVGVRPDPKLAADWYRKATELGGKPAQLSQSDAGK